MGDEMHDLALTLNLAVNANHAGAKNHAPVFFEGLHPHDEIDVADFFLDGDENHKLRNMAPR